MPEGIELRNREGPSPDLKEALDEIANPSVPSVSATVPLTVPKLNALDYFVLFLYPSTLLLGYLMPKTKSYFASKHNLVNLLFVKNGWAWTSIAFWYHFSRLRRSDRLKAALRWALATFWWVLITQWCFGPPIMDRAFTATGGLCQIAQQEVAQPGLTSMPQNAAIVTSAACRAVRGKWSGGYDLSGHVFILVHSSLFLWYELYPILADGGEAATHAATKTVLSVLVLWWWMLLITAAFFHTWNEKITGLLAGFVEWAIVYFFAVRHPRTRDVVGVPHL
ncbi:hypothetical protein SAICODRAFT_60761 [Saitoella complicata NRRL Y-17804]|uniref:Acyl-coenzyme A diphosphatase SCS3 n=1 Tax=Saitoella complicata (strain BCRC 22490 / CBS 7301 / JCM 7358 / NBRC 10748 / NRRL Y-17804) TaxID=698492 RepID=A0A0E9NF59_SAICN|nr:uncharacterized protein SAICODRAFT_60761 [Saitoella complicata NRRL Y-17804]ODQ50858.1 hypothetical protein SAICODRAFT_60761 [Saitoella complicata NRRL Y-17804]GAO48351.1 hypothetical protein G7K_2524-t1 [Saitoella complicata NRRL Y-17804]